MPHGLVGLDGGVFKDKVGVISRLGRQTRA